MVRNCRIPHEKVTVNLAVQRFSGQLGENKTNSFKSSYRQMVRVGSLPVYPSLH